MHGIIYPAWTDAIIAAAGLATILAFRNIRHKVRLGYIAMATTEVLFISIAFRAYEAQDLVGLWMFAVLAAAVALFGKRLAEYFMTLHLRK